MIAEVFEALVSESFSLQSLLDHRSFLLYVRHAYVQSNSHCLPRRPRLRRRYRSIHHQPGVDADQ